MICSDSQSVLSSLAQGTFGSSSEMAAVRDALRRVEGNVVFQWVSGHCGLLGNKEADQAAGEAANLEIRDGELHHVQQPVSYQAAIRP